MDYSPEEFRELLRQASEAVVQLHEKQASGRVTGEHPLASVRARFEEPLPWDPTPAEEVIRRVASDVIESSSLTIHPQFYGYVLSAGTQVGAIAALLQFGANLCGSTWDLSAASAEIERNVLRWIAEFIGYSGDGGGLTSSGTSANLVCLFAARWRALERGADPTRLAVYVSEEAHSSIGDALRLMGLRPDQLKKVPAGEDFRVDCGALAKAVGEDRRAGLVPMCVVGTAGSTNTGAVDDLRAVGAVAREHDAWFHIDAAYGGPAAATRLAGRLFRGLDLGDSVSLDPHKWLYAPIATGCVLVKRSDSLAGIFHDLPTYLTTAAGESQARLDWMDYSYRYTREASALRVWMTFLVHGAAAIRREIEENIATMRYLGRQIDRAPDFERLAPVPLSTVCFRYRPQVRQEFLTDEGLDALNARLSRALKADGRVFLPATRIRGTVALRACTTNHRNRRHHVDRMLEIVREVGGALLLEMKPGAVPMKG